MGEKNNMKKINILWGTMFFVILLSSCFKEEPLNNGTHERREVTITQTITTGAKINDGQTAYEGGNKQLVEQTFLSNPSSVAIFAYDALDILDYVGLDKTSITILGIPKSNIPNYLSKYQHKNYKNVGTLFMPDVDALDLFFPDLIIIGGRTTATYDMLKSKYPEADILDISFVYGQYMECLKLNTDNLGKIFPTIKADLDREFLTIKAEINDIHLVAKNHDALFVLVNGSTLSFYGRDGRFSVLYDEFGFKTSVEKEDSGQSHGDLIGYEYIAAVNPSIIFLMDRGAAIGDASGIEAILNNALIKKTDAGKNNNIYELNGVAWYISAGGFTSTYQMIMDLESFTKK